MQPTDMAHWPGTPGRARLQAAHTLILEGDLTETALALSQPHLNDLALDDALMPLNLAQAELFTEWAHQEMEHLDLAEQINNVLDLTHIALRANTKSTIGMVIHIPRGHHHDPDPATGGDAYIITCLNRNPEWVGLNPYLTMVKDLQLHVVTSSADPDQPSIIIATHDWGDTPDDTNRAAPDTSLAHTLEMIAQWHGATGCHWHGNPPKAHQS